MSPGEQAHVLLFDSLSLSPKVYGGSPTFQNTNRVFDPQEVWSVIFPFFSLNLKWFRVVMQACKILND